MPGGQWDQVLAPEYGNLVVEDQPAARLEVVVQPAQRLLVLLTGRAETQAAADVDRPVPPRKVEVVHGLAGQRRRGADRRGRLAAEGNHVGRDVDPVDVQPVRDVRHEQAAGATGDVERRLALLDELAEVLDLRAGVAEQRPPPGHHPVVPALRLDRLHVENRSPFMDHGRLPTRRTSRSCSGIALPAGRIPVSRSGAPARSTTRRASASIESTIVGSSTPRSSCRTDSSVHPSTTASAPRSRRCPTTASKRSRDTGIPALTPS